MFSPNTTIESSRKSWQHVNVKVVLTPMDILQWESLAVLLVEVYRQSGEKDSYIGQIPSDQSVGHEEQEDWMKFWWGQVRLTMVYYLKKKKHLRLFTRAHTKSWTATLVRRIALRATVLVATHSGLNWECGTSKWSALYVQTDNYVVMKTERHRYCIRIKTWPSGRHRHRN